MFVSATGLVTASVYTWARDRWFMAIESFLESSWEPSSLPQFRAIVQIHVLPLSHFCCRICRLHERKTCIILARVVWNHKMEPWSLNQCTLIWAYAITYVPVKLKVALICLKVGSGPFLSTLTNRSAACCKEMGAFSSFDWRLRRDFHGSCCTNRGIARKCWSHLANIKRWT